MTTGKFVTAMSFPLHCVSITSIRTLQMYCSFHVQFPWDFPWTWPSRCYYLSTMCIKCSEFFNGILRNTQEIMVKVFLLEVGKTTSVDVINITLILVYLFYPLCLYEEHYSRHNSNYTSVFTMLYNVLFHVTEIANII